MRGDIDIELAFVPVEFAPCIGRAGGRDAHNGESTRSAVVVGSTGVTDDANVYRFTSQWAKLA